MLTLGTKEKTKRANLVQKHRDKAPTKKKRTGKFSCLWKILIVSKLTFCTTPFQTQIKNLLMKAWGWLETLRSLLAWLNKKTLRKLYKLVFLKWEQSNLEMHTELLQSKQLFQFLISISIWRMTWSNDQRLSNYLSESNNNRVQYLPHLNRLGLMFQNRNYIAMTGCSCAKWSR